jgi:hypothetical protein
MAHMLPPSGVFTCRGSQGEGGTEMPHNKIASRGSRSLGDH